MALLLNEVETRVLAALVEKQITTPEYYPLTLNALVQACNQKTNREPVVNYDESTVSTGIDTLREKNLVYLFHGSGSRVLKYKHLLPEVYELNYAETALLAVLMLRGAQTVGELRERAGRMYDFSGLAEVEETLNGLIGRESNPLVVKLPRQPGQKDARYAHLLSGEPVLPAVEAQPTRSGEPNRITVLEQKVEELTAEVSSLKQMFEDFKKQFE
jgi:uncharacterized protein